MVVPAVALTTKVYLVRFGTSAGTPCSTPVEVSSSPEGRLPAIME